MSWIARRKNQVWYYGWREDGKDKYLSLKTRKKPVAERKKIEEDNKRDNPEYAPEPKAIHDPTCTDFWTAYTKKFQSEYRPSSWSAKEWAWNRLCNAMCAATLSDITHDRLIALRASWAQSPATFNDMLRACAGIWRLGAKHKLHGLEVNPFDDVKGLKEVRENLPVLTFDQIETLCWHAAKHSITPNGNRKEVVTASNIWAMFVLTGYFGLRSIEAENARWEWIDWKRGNFTVTQSGQFTTKNGTNRTMPLFASARRWLEHARKDTGYIFRTDYEIIKPKHGRVVEYRKSWDHVCAIAGLPDVYPHLMRHSWITNLLHLGFNMHEVAAYSGHSSLYIQQRYTHAMPIEAGKAERV